jgi:sigma-E factor negative regulatory protein RseA
VFALSAAASLLAVSVVAWMTLQISPEAPLQTANIRPVNTQIQTKSNDYLLAHEELSPGYEMSGAANFRTATFKPEEKMP